MRAAVTEKEFLFSHATHPGAEGRYRKMTAGFWRFRKSLKDWHAIKEGSFVARGGRRGGIPPNDGVAF